MQPNKPNANTSLSAGVCGSSDADQNLSVSRPLWSTRVVSLGDYIRQLCKVSNQPNKHEQRTQSSESNQSHVCYHDPNRHCNCAERCPVKQLNEPNKHGWKLCPVNGKLCSVTDCPTECHERFNSESTKGQDIYSRIRAGTIYRANIQNDAPSGKLVPRPADWSGNTK